MCVARPLLASGPFRPYPRGLVDPKFSDSDFADEFPETEVIGTDISPIQPDLVPPNLRL